MQYMCCMNPKKLLKCLLSPISISMLIYFFVAATPVLCWDCSAPSPDIKKSVQPDNACPGDLVLITITTTYYKVISDYPCMSVVDHIETYSYPNVAGPDEAKNCPNPPITSPPAIQQPTAPGPPESPGPSPSPNSCSDLSSGGSGASGGTGDGDSGDSLRALNH